MDSLIESTYPDSIGSIRPNHVVRGDEDIHRIDSDSLTKSTDPGSVRVFQVRTTGLQQPLEPLVDLRCETRGIPRGGPPDPPPKKPSQKAAASSPLALPIYDAMAPGMSQSPAPAPGPCGPRGHFKGEAQVKDFFHTLLHYGGYNEMVNILVNLTNLATEMGRLVYEGYVLMVLAPNDEAITKLSIEKIAELGSIDAIMYYHIVPEYQT